MTYTDWSVVDGETSTHTKLNQLGDNDAGFVDGTNFDNDILTSRHFADDAVWKRLGEVAAIGGETQLRVDIADPKEHMFLFMHAECAAGNFATGFRFNNDIGTNMAYWIQSDFGSATQVPSRSTFGFGVQTTPGDRDAIVEIINKKNQRKCFWMDGIYINEGMSPGAIPPHQNLLYGKWDNVVDQITRIDLFTSVGSGTPGTFDAGTGFVVFGRD